MAAPKSPIMIGCRLPHGLQLTLPAKREGENAHLQPRLQINGLNKAPFPGAPYATTIVDGEAWAAWKLLNPEFPALKSGALFEVKSTRPEEVAAAAADAAAQPTGLEALKPESEGVKPDDGTDGE